jgi:hypothetical protein
MEELFNTILQKALINGLEDNVDCEKTIFNLNLTLINLIFVHHYNLFNRIRIPIAFILLLF